MYDELMSELIVSFEKYHLLICSVAQLSPDFWDKIN